jgi:hypothetical protein
MSNHILKNLPLESYDFWIIEEEKHNLIAKKCFEKLMNLPEELFEHNKEKKKVLANYKQELIDFYNELTN